MRPHRSAAGIVLCMALALAPSARAGNIPLDEPPPPHRSSPASSALGVAWAVLAYLPNRVFDLTDIVRFQVRLGPGWALGARVTRALPFFVGGYSATWLGLPGPRGRPSIPFPAGLAAQSGFNFGPTPAGGSQGPSYGVGEIGAGFQLYMVGFDVGFDPVELADFFAGFACVDFAHDDF
jgi:hypothetical protein